MRRQATGPTLPWPYEGERRQVFLKRFNASGEAKQAYPLTTPRALAADNQWEKAYGASLVSVHMDGDTFLIYGSQTERFERP